LKPCNHIVCVKCFHQEVPASYSLQCPCSNCQEWISSSILLELGTASNIPSASPTTNGIITKPVQEVIHFEPDEQMDPFRYWAIKKPHLYSGFIYAAFRQSNDEASFYKASFKTLNSTVYMDDTSKDDLVKIFARILYPLLFHKNFQEQHATSNINKTVSQIDDDISTYNIPPGPPSGLHGRQEFALRCLFALSSGRIMSEEEQNDISTDQNKTNSQKKLKEKAIYCAKSIAKELLPTKTTAAQKSKPTESNPERDRRSSPAYSGTQLQENARSHINMDSTPFPSLKEKGAVDDKDDDSENNIPIILGFLLLSAVLIISN
jgi:hypothetical protein